MALRASTSLRTSPPSASLVILPRRIPRPDSPSGQAWWLRTFLLYSLGLSIAIIKINTETAGVAGTPFIYGQNMTTPYMARYVCTFKWTFLGLLGLPGVRSADHSMAFIVSRILQKALKTGKVGAVRTTKRDDLWCYEGFRVWNAKKDGCAHSERYL